jgi:hypothetical protein
MTNFIPLDVINKLSPRFARTKGGSCNQLLYDVRGEVDHGWFICKQPKMS